MINEPSDGASMPRRSLKLSAASVGAVGSLGSSAAGEPQAAPAPGGTRRRTRPTARRALRPFNSQYSGDLTNQLAFPMGGIGAGMICLEGSGALSHVSLRNRPEVYKEPCIFAAVAIKGDPSLTRVLEGPVPARKIFGPPDTGNGAGGKTYGLPRFSDASFKTRFPFGTVTLADPALPLHVELTGWSPFIPGQADDSSLPVAALEYRFTNQGKTKVEAVFSFNSKTLWGWTSIPRRLRPIEGGFILWGGGSTDQPWDSGAFSATVSEPGLKVNHAWFRGGWWDPLTWPEKLKLRESAGGPAAHGRALPVQARACLCPLNSHLGLPKPLNFGWPGSPARRTSR